MGHQRHHDEAMTGSTTNNDTIFNTLKTMNYFYTLLTCLLLAALPSCKSKVTATEFPLDKASTMKVTNIFYKDSILAFLSVTGDSNAALANDYVKKAENVKDNDFKKAAYYYKRAITLYPIESYYLRYADALYEKGKYNEAFYVYDILLTLNPTQSSDVYVRILKNTLLSSKTYAYYSYLTNFHSQNYDLEIIKTKVENDEQIKTSVSPEELKDFVSAYINIWEIVLEEDDERRTGATFEDYIKEFEPVTLPFGVEKKELQRFVYDNMRIEDFDGYDPSMDFSRFKEHELFKAKYYVKTDFQYLIKQADGFTIVIHAADTSAEAVPGDFRCIFHRLMVYNSNGNLLDSKIIGEHAGANFTTYTVYPDLSIITRNHIRQWKKPFSRYEIDNEILRTEPTTTVTYRVTDTGEIKTAELP